MENSINFIHPKALIQTSTDKKLFVKENGDWKEKDSELFKSEYHLPSEEGKTGDYFAKYYRRYNYIKYSENFEEYPWNINNLTLSKEPLFRFPYNICQKIKGLQTYGEHSLSYNFYNDLNTPYTFSIYAKLGDLSNIQLSSENINLANVGTSKQLRVTYTPETAFKKAVSLFAPEVKSNKITITSDERGVVISLAADSFFKKGSAELNIEETRDALLHLSEFFNYPEIKDRRFRIEGHTDNTPVSEVIPDALDEDFEDESSSSEDSSTNVKYIQKFNSNWELSSQRAINVLYYLADFGVDEQKFCVAGYADTRPKFDNSTPEGQAYNRRVDIIILDEGHF